MNAQVDNTTVINMLSVLTTSGHSRVIARAAILEMDCPVKVYTAAYFIKYLDMSIPVEFANGSTWTIFCFI